MSPDTLRSIHGVALVICLLAGAYLAFAPFESPPGLAYDKANHLLAFALMAWLADGGWPGRERAWKRWGWLLSYGLFIELVQYELPYRDFSWLDLLADFLGLMTYELIKLGLALARPAP